MYLVVSVCDGVGLYFLVNRYLGCRIAEVALGVMTCPLREFLAVNDINKLCDCSF